MFCKVVCAGAFLLVARRSTSHVRAPCTCMLGRTRERIAVDVAAAAYGFTYHAATRMGIRDSRIAQMAKDA
jgi:hypothetical protein